MPFATAATQEVIMPFINEEAGVGGSYSRYTCSIAETMPSCFITLL